MSARQKQELEEERQKYIDMGYKDGYSDGYSEGYEKGRVDIEENYGYLFPWEIKEKYYESYLDIYSEGYYDGYNDGTSWKEYSY